MALFKSHKYLFSIYGMLKSPKFHEARLCAEELHISNPAKFAKPDVIGMEEFDWAEFVEYAKKVAGKCERKIWSFDGPVIVYVDFEYLGGLGEFLDFVGFRFLYKTQKEPEYFEKIASDVYKNHVIDSLRKYVYLDINIECKPAGRLIIQLFNDVVPKTCQNFLLLCTGERGYNEKGLRLSYGETWFHRMMENSWIQGGDLRRGAASWDPAQSSAYFGEFDDENFGVSHDRRGILTMANRGRHTNGAQFAINFQENKWMDKTHVAFGRIIDGSGVLKAMQNVPIDPLMQTPLKDIDIVDSGEIYAYPCICKDPQQES